MDQKEKMKELIKKKQGGGRSKQMETPKNDRKNMRKGPKILINRRAKERLRSVNFCYCFLVFLVSLHYFGDLPIRTDELCKIKSGSE